MKSKIAKLVMVLIITLACAALTDAQTPKDFLITKNSVGRVILGMTVGEARKIWKNYRFERTSDGEFSSLIAVKKGDRHLMTMSADEKGYLNKNSPIQDSARIEFIEVWDKSFKTDKGVYPGMLLKNAERIYGKIKRITRSEIESREYADFTRQPEGMDFRLSSKKEFAGVRYHRITRGEQQGLEITRNYVPSAYIFNITIRRPGDDIESAEKQVAETKLTGFYADLTTDDVESGNWKYDKNNRKTLDHLNNDRSFISLYRCPKNR